MSDFIFFIKRKISFFERNKMESSLNESNEGDVKKIGKIRENSNEENARKKISTPFLPKIDKAKERLRNFLEENLTNEMYCAILNTIYTPHVILKVSLMFFLLIAHGLAAYNAIDLITSYFNYDVATTIRYINELPAVFPKVTICNQNRFTTKYAYEYLKNMNSGLLDLSEIKNSSRNDAKFKFQIFDNVLKGIMSNMSNAEKQKFSHAISDILISCQFNSLACTEHDFTWEYDPFFGNCWSFNSGFNSTGNQVDLRHTNIVGPLYGLKLELYMNGYEKLRGFNSIAGGIGGVIRVDNITHVVDHLNDRILIPTGFVTNLAVGREFHYSLPKPYSECVLDYEGSSSYLYNLIKNSKYEYNQGFCLNQCLQQLFKEKCGCIIGVFASVMNENICSAVHNVTCLVNVYYEIYVKNDSYIQNECIPQCPLTCNSAQFNYRTSFFTILGESLSEILKSNSNISEDFLTQNITSDAVKESVSSVNIYYDSMSYMISEESPQWTITSLISTIGGNLGLFLSMSLFSFAELITTMVEFYYFRKNNRDIDSMNSVGHLP
jgi:hypothetical protein